MSPTKPAVSHPRIAKNKLGYIPRDYEGVMSTLCAGCGHDSITAAIIQAFYELNIAPHEAIKVSGIGCSSKTPTYFLQQSHGFNSVHGRMPAIASGANAANPNLTYIGVSGDGDSLAIGLSHLSHAIRRNVNMLYVIENNGVYGLTKGQFSASADKGSKSKKGDVVELEAIDPVQVALTMGATFVARSFSGDKDQLVPLIKAGLTHKGFVLLDVISPCVTFNDHEGSTKSYKSTRKNCIEMVHTDFVPPEEEITTSMAPGETRDVDLHGGGTIRLHRVNEDYDPSDRAKVSAYIRECQERGEVATGLLYFNPETNDMHERHGSVDEALNTLSYDKLCPGNDALQKLQAKLK